MVSIQSLPATPPCRDFSPEAWERIDEILARRAGRPGSLIPALEEIQGITGYLPESVQRRVAAGLSLPLSQVYGVVTFYSFFTMKPRGQHQVRVCLGTACHVAGAPLVLAALEEQLGCEPGNLSADGAFGLEVVRCLGACGLAPVVEIDGTTHSGVRPGQVAGLLDACRSRSAGEEAARSTARPAA
jgi:NADH:ubiquinone oxidoreductase subunit E